MLIASTTEQQDDEMVPDGLARDSVRALRQVEDDGELDDMVALLRSDAELSRVGHPRSLIGRDGARRFWQGHRAAAAEISSRFTHATSTEERVVLEWNAQARLHDGKSTTVDGVSVLDLGDGDGDLTGFRTYYDTRDFRVLTAGTLRIALVITAVHSAPP